MGGKGRALVAELLRFHLVGAGTLVVGTLVFLAMVAAGVDYVLALAGDYAAGILFSYFMNKRYTFRVEVVSDAKSLSVTVLTYALTFGLNVLLLSLAVEVLGYGVVPSQIAIMLLLALLNYLMFKFVVFGLLAEGKAGTQASPGERSK